MFPNAPAKMSDKQTTKPLEALETDLIPQIHEEEHTDDDAEQGEYQFALRNIQDPPEGHTIVLDEMQEGPVFEQGDLALVSHVELHPDLQPLIRKDHGPDYEQSPLHVVKISGSCAS